MTDKIKSIGEYEYRDPDTAFRDAIANGTLNTDHLTKIRPLRVTWNQFINLQTRQSPALKERRIYDSANYL
mgnify:CR=1 FL=1